MGLLWDGVIPTGIGVVTNKGGVVGEGDVRFGGGVDLWAVVRKLAILKSWFRLVVSNGGACCNEKD